MIDTVRETITRNGLLEKGDSVIVALSGGADSVTLLHIMLALREELSLTVYAAHLNHNLRGEEAQRDEDFVTELCKEWGVELFKRSENVAAVARMLGISDELCGRNLRYEFFAELSQKLCAKVATAHTLSDCEETMLYNISRGTSLHGLCSIPAKRGNIVRLLIDLTRKDIEEYISAHGLDYVEDSTNAMEEICKRNSIRHNVLPPLRKINEGFDENFRRLRRRLIAVDSYMQKQARESLDRARVSFGLDSRALLQSDEAVLGEALYLYAKDMGAPVCEVHIELMEKILREGGAVDLPEGFRAVCKQGRFRIRRDEKQEEFVPITLIDELNIEYSGKEYFFKKINFLENFNRKSTDFILDCDKISSDAFLRTRREGDTFAPCGRNITKPLRKLQSELKIPSELRGESLVIAEGNKVLWAEHIGTSRHGAVDENTKLALCIKIGEDEEDA